MTVCILSNNTVKLMPRGLSDLGQISVTAPALPRGTYFWRLKRLLLVPKAPTVGVLLPYILYISLRLPKSDRLLAVSNTSIAHTK